MVRSTLISDLAISNRQRFSRSEDPMVRGLALRSLCGLRLDSILEYIHDPLQNSLTDTSSYVRKTGVIGILKVFSLNPDLIRETGMVDTLYNMLRDRDPQVVSNCVVALNEIMADEGGMATNQQIIMHLLNRITDFNEWGQCNVLQLVSKYKPVDQEEKFQIMNILEQCLRVSNSAVVLGTATCFLQITEDMPEIQEQVFQRLKQPMLTLLAGGSHEINYCVLHHINLMTQRCPGVFNPDYRQFYARYNEPTHIKYIKIDIMAEVADEINVADIIAELSEYVTDVDQEMARLAIRGIARIAVKVEQAAHQVFDALVDFLEMDMGYVRAQTMVVMKDLLRKYPEDRHDVLPLLPKLIKSIDDIDGKCAVIWMIGEYGEDIRRAPYVLEPLIDNFEEETSTAILMDLLSASMKLFFKRPPEMQSMLGRLLEAAINDAKNQDVHDRALLYYRLLENDVSFAASVLNLQKDGIATFAEMEDSDIQDTLIREFNSLSVIYGKPSETFVSVEEAAYDDEEDDNEEEESEAYSRPPPQVHQPEAQHAPAPSTGIDLLDMDFGGGAPAAPEPVQAPVFSLVPQATMDAGLFQQKWGSLQPCQMANFHFRSIPVQADIERDLLNAGIKTMASGDVGGQYKFFFYAQDVRGNFYMAESMVDKSNGVMTATIKADDESGAGLFLGEMQQAVARFT